eukprot:GHVT01066180.1.p1 GENE.GHVT01066180.1~~GHVT01066180.1.p1  ORF type:complete len:251 (+),score=29.09 GHVT01066180.1:511-1263(+)
MLLPLPLPLPCLVLLRVLSVVLPVSNFDLANCCRLLASARLMSVAFQRGGNPSRLWWGVPSGRGAEATPSTWRTEGARGLAGSRGVEGKQPQAKTNGKTAAATTGSTRSSKEKFKSEKELGQKIYKSETHHHEIYLAGAYPFFYSWCYYSLQYTLYNPLFSLNLASSSFSSASDYSTSEQPPSDSWSTYFPRNQIYLSTIALTDFNLRRCTKGRISRSTSSADHPPIEQSAILASAQPHHQARCQLVTTH